MCYVRAEFGRSTSAGVGINTMNTRKKIVARCSLKRGGASLTSYKHHSHTGYAAEIDRCWSNGTSVRIEFRLKKKRVPCVPGPQAWNRLPAALRHTDCVASFKRQLKTVLFMEAYYVRQRTVLTAFSTHICLQLLLIVVRRILFYSILFYRILLPYFCPAPLSNSVRGALQIPLID